jgi:hypothetical protein
LLAAVAAVLQVWLAAAVVLVDLEQQQVLLFLQV